MTTTAQALAAMLAARDAMRATGRDLQDTLAALDATDAAFDSRERHDARPAVPARRPADRLRKGQGRPVLSGRAGRRQAARAEARAAVREMRTRGEHPHRHARAIGHVQRALCLASWGRTAREFLQQLGFAEWERYESAFGRAVAKAYRETHGTEPERHARVVMRGRLWRVMSYRDEKDLYAGALAYKRTAGLLSAA